MSTECLVYAGLRLTTKHHLVPFWQGEDGDIFGMKANVGAVIGESWFFNKNGSSYIIRGENGPKRGEMLGTPEQIEKWTAAEQACKVHHAERRIRKKLAKRPDQFEQAMEPLRRMYKTLTYSGRAAFMMMILAELDR